jgi:hypothetical protein
MVLQKTLGGTPVPVGKHEGDIAYALDLIRFDELVRNADMAVNLWSAFGLAAERGDSEIIRHHARQLTVLTRAALALVKRLGEAEPDDGERARG